MPRASLLLIVGDFNATPYSPRFRALLGKSGLSLAGPRWPWPWSWPAGGALAVFSRALAGVVPGIPIDHVAVSGRFALSRHRYGPALGTDHHPIVVNLVLGPAGRAPRTLLPK